MDSRTTSLIHIKFDEGVFEIPSLWIHDHTYSFFRNLIAYEQCHDTGRPPCITSYDIMMDYLIYSPDEVAFLWDCGIISNQLGDDDKIPSVLSNLCKGISSNDGFYYRKLYDQVNHYYYDRYRYSKAKFKCDYCSNPWANISVAVAILLFFFTLSSTVFVTLHVFNIHTL
ncbi:hypothetical protein NE237_006114 [Protea cynaroides]|uniref:Uncharacterized protein n=1 Tax=Protea cynaroides TaxID=273540 RepID=A0A9Q0QUV1_9MAGN|nr:hypothetical protein NE237_006114 [Protea cynaroides]